MMTSSTQFSKPKYINETDACSRSLVGPKQEALLAARAETVQNVFHRDCSDAEVGKNPICLNEITYNDGTAISPKRNWVHVAEGGALIGVALMSGIGTSIFAITTSAEDLAKEYAPVGPLTSVERRAYTAIAGILAAGTGSIIGFSRIYQGLYGEELF
jgi:hypothetical protein